MGEANSGLRRDDDDDDNDDACISNSPCFFHSMRTRINRSF